MEKYEEGPYLEVKMPERSSFSSSLRMGAGWTRRSAWRFERLDNGSYICSEFSSGLWIRSSPTMAITSNM
jgi:hypothetical protein